MYGSNWIAPSHVFGNATPVGVSDTRSEQNYSPKTDFEPRRENQYFEWKNISMSGPPLDSTHFDTNMTNKTASPIDSITTKKRSQTIHHLHNQQIRQHDQHIYQRKKEKRTYQRTWSQTYHHQTHNKINIISGIIKITVNQIEKNTIKRKIVKNTRDRTRPNHF